MKTNEIDRALSAWAAVVASRAECARLVPSLEDVLEEPEQPEWTARVSTDSGETYDATRGKYEARQTVDLRTQAYYVLVARAIAGRPEWFRAYVLYAYPVTGRYARDGGQSVRKPNRFGQMETVWEGKDSDDLVRSFVDGPGAQMLCLTTLAARKAATTMLRKMVRRFRYDVRELLRNRETSEAENAS